LVFTDLKSSIFICVEYPSSRLEDLGKVFRTQLLQIPYRRIELLLDVIFLLANPVEPGIKK
jgi:hypothetical protein